MTNFMKCNKHSGFYSSSDDIKNFRFKVKLKEISKGIPILKTSSLDNNLQTENVSYSEEKLFTWQERILLPKKSMDTTNNIDASINEESKSIISSFKEKLFSYIDDDNYEAYEGAIINSFSNVKNLSEKLKFINYQNKSSGNIIKENMWNSENISNESKNQDKTNKRMYILADMNDYARDPTSLLNREHLLFSITYDCKTKNLIISPDFNDIEKDPYVLEISYGAKQLFHYSIEQIICDVDKKKLTEILAITKISQHENMIRLRKKHSIFWVPPKTVLHYTVILEIRSGSLFEYDNLFVEYTIDLPYGYKSKNQLNGKTQVSSVKGLEKLAHFGHIFEINIDNDMYREHPTEHFMTPRAYFEIISSDSWGRRRTEGYCHTSIPITNPGHHQISLKCVRPLGADRRTQNMKRFFTGGRDILKDVTCIYRPSTFQGDCLVKSSMTYESSGILNVCLSVIAQDGSLIVSEQGDGNEIAKENNVGRKIGTDSIFKSVHNVLKAYKQAEEKLKSIENI